MNINIPLVSYFFELVYSSDFLLSISVNESYLLTSPHEQITIWVGIFFFWNCVFFSKTGMFLQQIYMYISLTNIQISRSPRGDGDEEENNGILVRKWWMKPGFDYLEDGLPVDASVVRITSIDISHGVLPIWTSHKFKGTKNDHHGLIKPLTLYNWDDSPSTLHSSLSFTGRWTDLIQVLVGKDNPSPKWLDLFLAYLFCVFSFSLDMPVGLLPKTTSRKEVAVL